MQNKTEAIKALLKNGSFVVSERGTGKTAALVEILREDPNSVVVVHNEYAFRRIIDLYAVRYGHELDKKRILRGNTSPEKLKGTHFDGLSDLHKIYVDEFFMNEYRGSYFAAVSTSPRPVVVL